ncbi:MAG: hypothetical protein Unbinned3205contig1001_11 [Prokaryotic dsDNA virus sp.]|nr:MAG: hypothetical protein Unbinned3205contig1001_11 [Prokaryotic dsDNA virus sp.]|tara:strand:+ start:120 stop:266 length:147 start_codon:yes stop_codon:yes gene_type:complete
MQGKIDTLVFNSINVGAVSFSFMDVESILTIAVLISALIYNLKKIKND